AASRIFCTAGSSRPIRMAMIAITTNSSIRVKPRRFMRASSGRRRAAGVTKRRGKVSSYCRIRPTEDKGRIGEGPEWAARSGRQVQLDRPTFRHLGGEGGGRQRGVAAGDGRVGGPRDRSLRWGRRTVRVARVAAEGGIDDLHLVLAGDGAG